jgi:hypothetical protein
MNAKAHARFTAENLAALSRISARDAAMRVAAEGVRWIGGLLSEQDAIKLNQKLLAQQLLLAQTGLVQDLDYVADVLYGRDKK